MATSKVCTGCKEDKPLSFYHKDKCRKDGLACKCKACKSLVFKSQPEKSRKNHIASSKRWKENNLARHKELTAKWRAENKEYAKAYSKTHYENNKERSLELSRLWKKNNPNASRVIDHRSRAKRALAEGSYLKSDITALLENQTYRCACCKTSVKKKYTIDHVVPLARGGTNYKENLQILCKSCNSSKNARSSIEFMQSRGYLL